MTWGIWQIIGIYLLNVKPLAVTDDQLDGQEAMMKHVSVAEAKAKLSEILDGVIAGEEFIITRRGKEIARLGGIEGSKKRFDFDALRAHLETMPVSPGNAVVEMRELDRY